VAERTVGSSHSERVWVFDLGTYARVGGYVVAALAVAQVIKKGFRLPHPGTLVEAAGYLLLFAVLFSLAPVRRWFSAIPRTHQLVVMGFFFLVVTGQLTTDSRKTFPFPAWTMYGKQESPARLEYYRYRGIDAGGREVNVDPADVLGFVNVAEIASHVRFIARDSRLPEGDPKREPNRRKLNELLQAIATGYNLKHPEAQLRSLEFLWYSWDYLKVPAGDVVPERMLEIEIPEGGAK
jgi:hypothetical protein